MKKNTAATVITCATVGANVILSVVALALLTNKSEMEDRHNGR